MGGLRKELDLYSEEEGVYGFVGMVGLGGVMIKEELIEEELVEEEPVEKGRKDMADNRGRERQSIERQSIVNGKGLEHPF
nr:hypothetical protein CFP56_73675 [Quercus suber]